VQIDIFSQVRGSPNYSEVVEAEIFFRSWQYRS